MKEIFSYLENRKGVGWAAKIGGKYDLLISLFVANFEEFDQFIDEFNEKFPGLIKGYDSCYVLNHSFYRHKYLSNNFSHVSYGYNDDIVKIDETDLEILTKLKDNCRQSALDISKGKKFSYKTVINRIKALERKKIILGYRIFISSQEKKPFILLFSFKDYSKKDEKYLMSYLSSNKDVTQVIKLFGLWNCFVHVRIENNEKLQELVIRLREEFKIIKECEIIPVFQDISINLMPF